MSPLPFSQPELPVAEIIPAVKKQLSTGNSVIIQAPPGAGKSTLLPLSLLQEPWLDGKKILLLEPRRLATKSIAQRMSDLLREEVGQTVGYRIRFDTCVSSTTRLEVITEGILTRMLHQDNALEDVGMVIFDEFNTSEIVPDYIDPLGVWKSNTPLVTIPSSIVIIFLFSSLSE
ncbi:MAG: DEAD/DEAH box helicase, partial [Algoriphagus sp.]